MNAEKREIVGGEEEEEIFFLVVKYDWKTEKVGKEAAANRNMNEQTIGGC